MNRTCGRPAHEKPFLLLVTGYPEPGCRVPAAAGVKEGLGEIVSWL